MKAKDIRNLPIADKLADENSVMIARDGGISRMLLRNFRKYIAYAAGSDVLGVPVPTVSTAGMSPVVTEKGLYTLERVKGTDLLWKNQAPTANFPEQTIYCNTSAYKILVVVLKHSEHTTPDTVAFANDGAEARLSVFKTGTKAQSVTTISEEWRSAIANDTGVTFGIGTHTEYQMGYKESGGYAIPIAIYGIA